jgi:hypothetical protein
MGKGYFFIEGEEDAARIRRDIEGGKLTFEEVCALIDTRAMDSTVKAIDAELAEHNQGGVNAGTESGEERDG